MSTATIDITATQGVEQFEDDITFRLGMDGTTGLIPVPMPLRNTSAVDVLPPREAAPSPQFRVLSRLLAMADSYMKSGAMRQAQEMYFDLLQSHPDTVQADQAEQRLFELTERYERAGELRLARSIYEQLF